MAPVKSTPRVLIADELSPRALEIFRDRGFPPWPAAGRARRRDRRL